MREVPIKSDKRIIDALNNLLADELAAIDQYIEALQSEIEQMTLPTFLSTQGFF